MNVNYYVFSQRQPELKPVWEESNYIAQSFVDALKIQARRLFPEHHAGLLTFWKAQLGVWAAEGFEK